MAGRRSIRADEAQGVTFVELFFDLAFVFAVTEVTGYAAHHLDAAGIARATLVFWLVWWGWTQWTWALNPADTNHGAVRAGTLAGTGIAFLMAASVGLAYGDGALWFAVPYIAIRVLGLGLYLWVTFEETEHRAAVAAFSVFSATGLVAVLVGALVDPPARNWCWLAAIVLDLLAAARAGKLRGWVLHPGHFTERHGLFVIIALGESLVVAGSGAASGERSGTLVAVATAAVVVACLLWWTYFGWVKDALELAMVRATGPARTTLARDTYSFIHFAIVGGIVGFAVGVEEAVAHPADPLGGDVIAAFAVGVALFVAMTAAAYARATARVLFPRLGVLAIGLVAVAIVGDEPVSVLATIAVTLLAIAVLERGGDGGAGAVSPTATDRGDAPPDAG